MMICCSAFYFCVREKTWNHGSAHGSQDADDRDDDQEFDEGEAFMHKIILIRPYNRYD